MKQFVTFLTMAILAIVVFASCCQPKFEVAKVPVFNLSDLGGAKSFTAKSVVFTDPDEMSMKMLSPMVVGFVEQTVEEDQTDISLAMGTDVETFGMTKTASGRSFELSIPEGNISIDLNEASDTFTLVEDFIVDYDVLGGPGIDGSFYRLFTSTEFNGTETFHEEFIFKTYDATYDGTDWTANSIVAIKGEVFKTSTVYGVLMKSMITKTYGGGLPEMDTLPDPIDPHAWGPSEKTTEIGKLSTAGTPAFQDGVTYQDPDNPPLPEQTYYEYFLWIYENGSYTYKMDGLNSKGHFKYDDIGTVGDPSAYKAYGGTGIDLETTLAAYGWVVKGWE